MRLALFEPDIPQNTGSLLRLGACLGVGVDIIEPCGFLLTDKALRRVGMDYVELAEMRRFSSWERFQADRPSGRLILLTTKGAQPYLEFNFRPDDILLLGRESAGVPDAVHHAADARLLIPMQASARALNVTQAAAMVLGEALRQTGPHPL
jgi:tRNA (cytidine/uridine-2'-O-)-methyltransferase